MPALTFEKPLPDFPQSQYVVKSGSLIAIIVICYIFIIICCTARLYMKAVKSEMLLDDWLCLAALICITATFIAAVMAWKNGLGLHTWEVTESMYIQSTKWTYVAIVFYIPCVLSVKVAILLLFARVFAVKRPVAISIQVFIGVIVATLLPIQCLKVAMCRPISAYWELSPRPDQLRERCIDQEKLFKADIVVSMVTDTVLLLIPLPLIFTLNFSFWKKVRIFLSLTTGGLAAGITIYKGVIVFEESMTADKTSDMSVMAILSYVIHLISLLVYLGNMLTDALRSSFIEITIGIICACLPSISALIESLRKQQKTDPNRPRTGSSQKKHTQRSFYSHVLSSLKTGVVTANRFSTFDTELASFSGHPESPEKAVTLGSQGTGRCLRLDSRSGREEGWLTPIDDHDVRAGAASHTIPNAAFLLRDTEPVQWHDTVWDGNNEVLMGVAHSC